jgi:hypothetical protein
MFFVFPAEGDHEDQDKGGEDGGDFMHGVVVLMVRMKQL